MTKMPTTELQWIDAAARDDVPDGDGFPVVVAGLELALWGVDGEVFATDAMCTHGAARLCDSFLEGHEIECPLHQGRFDVRDGRALCAPLTRDLRSWPVRVEAGRVQVGVSADGG